LNPYFNPSGDDDGFGYYASDTIDLYKGAGISFRLSPGHAESETAVTWTVWVDWNQDGSFISHPDEKLLINLNETGDAIETVFLPASLPNGVFRMRIQMKQGGASLPCDVFPRGEVEDYSLRILGLVGADQPLSAGTFQLFPNPGEGLFRLTSDQMPLGPAQLQVFDMQGRLLWGEQANITNQAWQTHLDLRSHPQGVYLLRVQTDSGIWQQKLIHH
ncbi:MAG: GEVED domain-containing protein, partial [Bacteroidota bacterium]